MVSVCNLPADKHNNRGEKQAPGEEVFNKEHRCEHHKVTPVKNSAIYAAAILHDEGLKRTP
jgi:hypothetical protein